jgi:hypothetical protein
MTDTLKQCVLHIGSEKTGTTSIQQFFGKNRESLLDRGFWYPKSLAYEDGRVHRRLSDLGRAGDEEERRQTTEDFEKEIGHASASRAKVAVISSEFLHSTVRKRGGVARIRRFLEPHFDRIQVIYYARRQDQLVASMHSTAIRGGYSTDQSALSVYDSKGHHYFDHLQVCDLWASEFGEDNMICRIYERDRLLNGDIIDDFSAAVGLEIMTDRPHIASNKSLSTETMRALLLLNGSVHRDNTELRRRLVTLGSRRGGEQSPMLTKSDAMQFMERFEESNRMFFSKYVDPEFARSFSSDYSMFPDEIPGISAERILEFIFAARTKPAGKESE